MPKKKTILVTGGSGYIGSHTVRTLREAGFDVVIYDNLENGHPEAVRDFPLVKGSLSDNSALDALFSTHAFIGVIHFAAYIEMAESMVKPAKYFANNVCGSLHLLNAMTKAGVKSIIFSSTAGVYGNPKKIPIVETDPTVPTNPYGESKLMVERLLSWFHLTHGLNYVVLRYFNATGASLTGDIGEDHLHESHLIPNVFKAVQRGEKVFTINGGEYPTKDGTTIRDYIHVLDLADAHILSLKYLLEGGQPDTFNLGSGQGFTTREVVESVIKATNSQMQVATGPARPGDAIETVADSTKFQTKFNWQPRYSDLETIIATAWQWHRKHPNGYVS